MRNDKNMNLEVPNAKNMRNPLKKDFPKCGGPK